MHCMTDVTTMLWCLKFARLKIDAGCWFGKYITEGLCWDVCPGDQINMKGIATTYATTKYG